jgi:DNA-directed RNA polymerase specialized sigma24 family protein
VTSATLQPSGDDTGEDAALLCALQSDNPVCSDAAMTQIVRRYTSVIHQALIQLVDHDTAEDIGQALIIDLWERRATLHITGSLTAYLLGAAKRRVAQRRRNLHTAAQCLAAHSPHHRTTVENDALTELLLSDGLRIINQEYERATDARRTVFWHAFYEQASPAEIATTLGLTTSTVYWHLDKMWTAIERALTKQGLFEPGEIQQFLTKYATIQDGPRA